MGVRMLELNPRIKAKLSKKSIQPQVAPRWISEQLPQPNDTAASLLNKATVMEDGDLLFMAS